MRQSDCDTPSVLHILTSESWGGLELYAVHFIKKVMGSGVRTALYCKPHSKVSEEAVKLGITVYWARKKSHSGFGDALRVQKIVRDNQFSILHTHTRQDVRIASFSLIFLSRVKQIFSLYMSAPAKKSLWHRFIYGKVSAIVSSSELLNERIKKNYPLLPQHVHLIRYGRDFSQYRAMSQSERNKIRRLWDVGEQDLLIGTMCRIDPAKGVREIAESLLLLSSENKKKIKIWIIGEPTLHHTLPDGTPVYEEKSEQLASWLKTFSELSIVEDRIKLIPFQRDFIPYLSALDVFVLATYKETYSLSVIDAMCMGIPMIGTNSGGTPEQLEGRGLLVEPRSADTIAQAIKTYIEHPELMREYGIKGKNWAMLEHSWTNTLTAIKALYLEVSGS